MKSYISLACSLAISAFCILMGSCTADTDGTNNPPVLTTGNPVTTTRTSAIVSGLVNANDAIIEEYGIVYSQSSTQMLEGANYLKCDDVLSSKEFNIQIDGLNAGYTYFYRTYARNGGAYIYGDYKMFQTPSVSAPTFSEVSVTVNDLDAAFKTRITDTGVEKNSGINVASTNFKFRVMRAGETASTIKYSDSDASWQTVAGTYDENTGNLEATVIALAAETRYVVCATAVSAGLGISEMTEFTTGAGNINLPELSAVGIAEVEEPENSILLSASVVSEGTSAIEERGFVYSSYSPVPTVSNADSVRCGVEFSDTLVNLPYSTTFYIRAFAKNQSGYAYSAVTTHTTPNYVASVDVMTATSKDITDTSATLVGYLNSHSLPVTQIGFEVDGKMHVATLVKNGPFELNVTGFQPQTLHTFRAFATDTDGKMKYGSYVNFTTKSAAPNDGDILLPDFND